MAREATAGRFAPRRGAPVRSIEETLREAPKAAEPTRQLTARIPESLHRDLRQHLAVTDTSVQDFVRQAVANEIARQRGEVGD